MNRRVWIFLLLFAGLSAQPASAQLFVGEYNHHYTQSVHIHPRWRDSPN